jgi:hypothetical protein
VLTIDNWTLLLICGFVGVFAYAATLVTFAMEPDARRRLRAGLRKK